MRKVFEEKEKKYASLLWLSEDKNEKKFLLDWISFVTSKAALIFFHIHYFAEMTVKINLGILWLQTAQLSSFFKFKMILNNEEV